MKQLTFLALIFLFSLESLSQFTNGGNSFVLNNDSLSTQMSNGVSVFDYNLDGIDDVTIARYNIGVTGYISTGSQFIEDFTIPIVGNIKQVLYVDVNNDHILEIFITHYGGGIYLYKRNGLNQWELCQNSFSDYIGYPYGASWGDYDKDGDLDVFICEFNDLTFDIGLPNLLFRNDGNFQFSEIGADLGVNAVTNNSFQSVWTDFNNDGWLDLYVINDKEIPNLFYRNNQGVSFTEMAMDNHSNVTAFCMSNSISDFNQDGLWDVFITDDEDTYLLSQDSSFVFSEISDSLGFQPLINGWGALWIDGDYDGDDDLHIAQGWINAPSYNQYYINNQTDFHIANNFDNFYKSSFVNAKGDFNGDGLWDFIVRNEYPNDYNIFLGQNPTGNNSIKVTLQGVQSNSFGIGANIEVYSGGELIKKQWLCGENYISQNSQYQIIGLKNGTIDSLIINWPNGGKEKYDDVAVNSSYTFIEGAQFSSDTLTEELWICANTNYQFNLPATLIELSSGNSVLPISIGQTDTILCINPFGWTKVLILTTHEIPLPSVETTLSWDCNNAQHLLTINTNYETIIDTTVTHSSYVTSGVHHILVTDSLGCQKLDSIIVPAYIPPVIHLLSDTICFQDSVNLEVFTENGWGPIQLIAPPNYVQAGNLELQFSDAEGCSWTQNFYVTELSEIQYTNNYFGSDTITAEVTPIGGLPPYQIIWMDSTIGYSHTFMESGNYSFSIYDGFNCESQGIAEITIVPNIISPLNINHDFFITNEIIYSSNIINHFTVYDATGQIVMQFQLTENDSKSLSSLAKGIYFISNGRNMCRFIR